MAPGTSSDADGNGHELREATRWLQNMLDKLPVAIYRVDPNGILTFARGSFPPEHTDQAIGKPLAETYAQFPELIRAVDEAQRGRDQAFSASGHGRHYEFLVNGMRDGGGSHGVIGIIVEVTEQRRAAEAIAESEQKTRFLAAISHELRTPLNSILGFAELLLRADFGSLTDRQHRYVSHIKTSGRQLLGLINEPLDISKMQAGELAIGTEAVDPVPILTDIVERMGPIAQERGIELILGRQSHGRMSADPRRLSQIVMNVVSNALKFTPPGGQVAITSYRRFGALTIKVADNGVGIPPQHLDRIFEEFYQVPGARPPGPEVTGTGLGLALSRRLARAMGGDLTVRSSVGRGSTFLLTLPLVPARSTNG